MDDRFATSGAEAPPPYLGAAQPAGGMSERMQSLLSRAVEDQMAEQRQLQTLINDVRQSLAQIQEEIRQAAGAHTLEVVRGEVTSLGSEVRASTTMLGERLEAVVRAVGAGAQVMQGVGQQLDRVTELLNAQQQQIAALSGSVTQHGESLAALPESVGTRATASAQQVRNDVSGVSSEVAAVREDVGGVRDEVAELRARLDGVLADVRTDSAASVRALGDRIDAAVLALAEALLRPRQGAVISAEPDPAPSDQDDDRDVPATATMTMPVAPERPWSGAASAPDDADAVSEEPETPPVVEDEAPPEPEEPEEPETLVEEPDIEPDVAVAEEAAPEEAAPEDPAADVDEVPLDGWLAESAEAVEGEREPEPAAAASAWGWEGARDAAESDGGEKRRPWWRPGG